MDNKDNAPSLLSPEATGGLNAQQGFTYQSNLIVARIPSWLKDAGFTSFISESLGDVEAKFLDPSTGITREFIEYKNHPLGPAEFWKEVSRFIQLDRGAPGVYRKFILASKGISPSVKPILNSLSRLRDTTPFYSDTQVINEQTYKDFLERVIDAGQDQEMADFILAKVWFETDIADAEALPKEKFRESLYRAYPLFEELSGGQINRMYSGLVQLVDSRLGLPIHKNELKRLVWNNTPPGLNRPQTIQMHTIHNNKKQIFPTDWLVFDWEEFFCEDDRDFPNPQKWRNELLYQLRQTKTWITSNNFSRQIYLSGHRRLSASFAFGSVFSAVSGFHIEVKNRDGIWKTNSYPNAHTNEYRWKEFSTDIDNHTDLYITIGIKVGLQDEVTTFLDNEHSLGTRIHIKSNLALVSDKHINLAVEKAKEIIFRAIGKHDVNKVHLFLATPSHFALFLGHRLNTPTPIQCYERKAPNRYVPTCLVGPNDFKGN